MSVAIEKLKKSSERLITNAVLPPNVKGNTRQFLDFSIINLQWKTSKAFTDIKINICWWGESEGILCKGIKVNVNNKKIPEEPLRTIRYQVKTNDRLLFSYLRNADPVKLDIYSSKTGDFIGSSKFEIPLNFGEERHQSITLTSQILSSRQFNLGEIFVLLELHPESQLIQKIPMKESEMDCMKKNKDITALNDRNGNKENIQIIGKRKKISFREPVIQKSSTLVPKKIKPAKKAKDEDTATTTSTSSSKCEHPINVEKSSFINYLSGKPLSRVDEHDALKNLATVSPSESFIESLNAIKLNSAEPIFQNQLADTIDSIRISVYQVELSLAGQRETQSVINKSKLKKSILKCAVTSKCFNSSDDGIISPVFDNAPPRILITKEITKRIIKPLNNSSIFVNFGFCLKPIEQQTSPFYLGFSRVNLTEVIKSNGVFYKKCPIIHESGNLNVGSLKVKIELGINELHFGNQLTDSLHNRCENVSTCSDDSVIKQSPPVRLSDQKCQTKSHPSYSNQCDSNRNFENKTVQTEQAQRRQKSLSSVEDEVDDQDAEMLDVAKENPVLKPKIYCGLLFIEGLRNVKDQASVDHFITYEGFWNQCQESTELSIDFCFNYLKQFPVICDNEFLKRVQNNHLELKLWEKTGNSEKWIGSTKLPLHQFFIAFRDATMIEHLSFNQLPIISIDTWANFVSPLSNEMCCQGKVLLAIGRENQIDYLKLLRNLHNLRLPKKTDQPLDPNIQMKNKLSAFIESLSQNLPEPSVTNSFKKPAAVASRSTMTQPYLRKSSDLLHKLQSVASSTSTLSAPPELRKTSDLMDSLQKALLVQPPQSASPLNTVINNSLDNRFAISDSSVDSSFEEKIRVNVSIEHANHLPKVVKKKINRRKSKNATTPQKDDFEPSSYVTFESCLDRFNENSPPDNIVKSHEGFVNCTKVVKSCDPQWDQSFDVNLPLDVLTNPQKRFIIKVWRKIPQMSDMKPSPFEDAVIGFSAIDLSVLLTGLPVLSGYYNIMDFSSLCHGQIKISIRPLENVEQYQDSSTSITDTSSLLNPLSIDVDDNGPNLLSRTLKRKFTELDEITQRLKARLFDVTNDENFDPDDEFERDLNTAVDDTEENSNDKIDFSWLKTDENNGFQAQLDRILEPQPSTSKAGSSNLASRLVSGCSSSEPMAIDQLLKKYDLDTLINPNIFKNIYDPALANSDSTPTLNPRPVNTEDLANVSGDSGDTTVSSILSVDQIQTIQTAFQKASLTDGSEQGSSRKDPEGENNVSE